MATLVFRDEQGRVCRKQYATVGAAFACGYVLMHLRPARHLAGAVDEVVDGVLWVARGGGKRGKK